MTVLLKYFLLTFVTGILGPGIETWYSLKTESWLETLVLWKLLKLIIQFKMMT